MQYFLGFLSFFLLAISPDLSAEKAPDLRIMVKYKQTVPNVLSLKSQLATTLRTPVKDLKPMADGAYILSVDEKDLPVYGSQTLDRTEILLKRLKNNPNVVYAVRDRVGHFKPLPTVKNARVFAEVRHELQWNLFSRPGGIMLESAPNLKDGAWAYTTGFSNPETVVAVLDSGIAVHENLINNLVKDKDNRLFGWNFGGNNRNIEGNNPHGTHVAGTIAAYGSVIQGVGEHLKILPIKIPDASGMYYESQVINGIRWAVGEHIPGVPDNPYPAKVLNMSFGVDESPEKEMAHCGKPLQEAISYARSKGAVIVVAAGNENHWENYNAPAVCNGVVLVAATGPEGLRSAYSNYGPSVSLAAPGGDIENYDMLGGILSTVDPLNGYLGSGFDFYEGTSMASPHVSGVAGLIYAANPQLNGLAVEQLLYTTTHAFGKSDDPDNNCVASKPCGHGIVDAEYAVVAGMKQYDVVFSGPDTPSALLAPYDAPRWTPVKTLKTVKNNPSKSYVYQGNDHRIYARAHKKLYQLENGNYAQCEIIGFDGVGCYH